jgi:hypothetical protein
MPELRSAKNRREVRQTAFSEKTGNLRRQLSLLCMKTFTPKLAVEVKDYLEYVNRVPRPFTKFLQRQFGTKRLRGAEIGFGWGDNTESLLTELNIERLYCVDPYIMKPYREGSSYNTRYADPRRNKYPLIKQDPRVTFVELPREQGFKKLPRDLDLIYIDGNHHYDFVLSDLRNAFDHVRSKGFVGGHDFVRGQKERMVVAAVLDFALEVKQAPVIEMPDFWFKKC